MPAVRSIARAPIERQELQDFSRFDVPGDRPRSQERRFQGVIRSILLPSALSDRLIAAAKAQGVTLFSVAAAGLAMALQTATGQIRVAMGTQMSVRDQQELEGVVGPLINTVILRPRRSSKQHHCLRHSAVRCKAQRRHRTSPLAVRRDDGNGG